MDHTCSRAMSPTNGYVMKECIFFFCRKGERGGSACVLGEINLSIYFLCYNRNSERLTESLAVLGKDLQGVNKRCRIRTTCTLCTPGAPSTHADRQFQAVFRPGVAHRYFRILGYLLSRDPEQEVIDEGFYIVFHRTCFRTIVWIFYGIPRQCASNAARTRYWKGGLGVL